MHTKINNILLTSLLLTFFVISSCSGSHSRSKNDKPFTYNQITKKICQADTTQSYEVYLPGGYSPQQKWPVIYVFDPHGDGKLAVEHFKYAAEKYGYIILGSNNSKNGLQTLDHALDILLDDAKKSFAIDHNRQYAGGFSGGGRVALMLASKYGNIKGILTCGAGISGFNPQMASSKFDIYAIAGRADFNYDEVVAVRQQFANTDWRYITTSFDGGHAWPSPYLISRAVLWFQLNAMRDGIVPKDKEIVEETLDSVKLYYKQCMDKGQFIEASDECKNGISFLTGLTSIKKLEKKIEEIQIQDKYTEELRKAEQLSLMEQQLRQGFIQSFTSQGLDWWKNELSGLTDRIDQSNDLATRQMYSRVKGFLGIVCYSFTSKAIAENNESQANKCIVIYETLEPQNPDCFFYKAVLLDKRNQPAEAAVALKKAIGFGFKDMAKLKSSLSKETIQLFESQQK